MRFRRLISSINNLVLQISREITRLIGSLLYVISMNRIKTKILILSLLLITIVGCMDQDPFGFSEKTIAGDFYIKQWEDGKTFLLGEKGKTDSGYTDKIIKIGWNKNYILVWVERHNKNIKWLIIDISSNKISGPFNDEEIKNKLELIGIEAIDAGQAWEQL